MKVIVYILIGIIFASFGQIFFKVGANNIGEISLSNILQMINFYIFIGLIFYALGSFFWIIALSKADLSFVYPFIALTFIIVYILSVIFLKESVHLSRLVGMGIIIAGLLVMNLFD